MRGGASHFRAHPGVRPGCEASRGRWLNRVPTSNRGVGSGAVVTAEHVRAQPHDNVSGPLRFRNRAVARRPSRSRRCGGRARRRRGAAASASRGGGAVLVRVLMRVSSRTPLNETAVTAWSRSTAIVAGCCGSRVIGLGSGVVQPQARPWPVNGQQPSPAARRDECRPVVGAAETDVRRQRVVEGRVGLGAGRVEERDAA